MKIWEILKDENIGKNVKSELGEFRIACFNKYKGDILVEHNVLLYYKQSMILFSVPTDKLNIEWEIIEDAKTEWERVEENEVYFYVGDDGKVHVDNDIYTVTDNRRYEIANYSINKSNMEFKALRDILLSKMQRWADIHNEEKIDWNNCNQAKYSIYYHYNCNNLEITNYCNVRDFGQVYFTSYELAEQCLEEFKDELLKYCRFGMED